MRLSKTFSPALLGASLATFAAGALSTAHAQHPSSDPHEEKGLEVPGGDIFGFTSPTDVGNKGDHGLALELSNRAGKREVTGRTP